MAARKTTSPSALRTVDEAGARGVTAAARTARPRLKSPDASLFTRAPASADDGARPHGAERLVADASGIPQQHAPRLRRGRRAHRFGAQVEGRAPDPWRREDV